MLNVLKTVPAVCFALLLSSQMAGAGEFSRLPELGPVPQPRPIHMVEVKATADTNLATQASCAGDCTAYFVVANPMP